MKPHPPSYEPSLLADAVRKFFQSSSEGDSTLKGEALKHAGSLLIHNILDKTLGIEKTYAISEDLYIISDNGDCERFHAVCKAANEFVSRVLGIRRPIILIEITNSLTLPHMLSGYDGFGILRINREFLGRRSEYELLAHEFTHAAVLSGNLFLDEGLATCVETLAGGGTPEAWELPTSAPPIEVIVNSDWTDDPYLTRLKEFEIQAPHEFAASFVWGLANTLRPKQPLAGLSLIVSRLSRHKAALNSFSAYNALVTDNEKTRHNPDRPEPSCLTPKQVAAIEHYFTTGRSTLKNEDASQFTKIVRSGLDSEAARTLAKYYISLYLEQARKDPVTAAFASQCIRVALENPTEIKTSILQPYKLCIEAYRARSAVQRNFVFGMMLSEFQKLVSLFPDDPEVLLAVAKAQTQAPEGLRLSDFNMAEKLRSFFDDGETSSLVGQLLRHPSIASYDLDSVQV